MDSVNHLENHPHAFIKGVLVTNVALFADHDDDLLELIRTEQGADEVVSCCEFGVASIGWAWTGSEFRPPRPYESWTWSDKDKAWVAPVPYPSGEVRHLWDEASQSWVEAVPEEQPEA